MKRFISYFVGLILFVSISGCLNDDDIDEANSEDLSLTITSKNNKISIDDKINIKIELENIAKEPIKIRNNFFLSGGLTCILTDTNNITIVNEDLYKDRELKTEILEKGEKKSMELDLKSIPLEFISNSTSFLWFPDNYQIHFEYDDNGIYLKSNTINIEVI